MVDQLPALVDEVQVAPVGQGHIPAHLFNAVEAHIHQQHAPLGGPIPGELDVVAQGHHPAVGVIRVAEDILHVGGGEVQVLHIPAGRLEPVAVGGVGVLLHQGQGDGGHQPPAAVEDRQGHQVVPVGLVEEAELAG